MYLIDAALWQQWEGRLEGIRLKVGYQFKNYPYNNPGKARDSMKEVAVGMEGGNRYERH